MAVQNPFGYGLIEDSFKPMASANWPDSQNLSHSHSGWLDLILGVGFPGFLFIGFALLLNVWHCKSAIGLRKSIVFWALIANLMLWVTTEAAATISFSVLIFWLSLASGLTLTDKGQERRV